VPVDIPLATGLDPALVDAPAPEVVPAPIDALPAPAPEWIAIPAETLPAPVDAPQIPEPAPIDQFEVIDVALADYAPHNAPAPLAPAVQGGWTLESSSATVQPEQWGLPLAPVDAPAAPAPESVAAPDPLAQFDPADLPVPAVDVANVVVPAATPAQPEGVPHLSSPDNLPPNADYLGELLNAVHSQDISGNDALSALEQRPFNV
jgi:resuscitation-promoting factor RpfA